MKQFRMLTDRIWSLPPVAMLLLAAAPTQEVLMPLNFHGRWNLKLQDCSRFSDAKEIRVFGNMIELVGYKGSINKVIILNSNTVDVQYTISDGSGEFHDSETYILRDGGRALQVGTVDDAPVFYKCPLITENGISNAQNQ